MSIRRNSLKVNDLKKAAAAIRGDHGTLYDTRPFLDLVFTASIIVRKHIR